ncbi:MAG: hypothetical protein RL095_1949 [Verrucomicrobiota bacterium]|jgi:molybdopterin molybdotransferase
MISSAEAFALVLAAAPDYGVEEIDLLDACGRVLRQPICADREHPPFDRVSMDGIALNVADWSRGQRRFRIAGCQAAGMAPLSLSPESCLEAMTGAILPQGADGVIPVEHLRRDGDWAVLPEDYAFEAGMNVHPRGSDHARGAELLPAGIVLNPPRLALAATCGRRKLRVARLPEAAVIATGDELVAPDTTPLPWQIRRSNSFAIAAGLRGLGIKASEHHLPDKEQELEERLAAILASKELVVLSGGVSAGKFDLIPATLRRLGCEVLFHQVSQRPGKPLLFARKGNTLVYGLPGNPVSALVNFHRYVLPQVRQSLGLPQTQCLALLAEELVFKKPLTLYQPVRLVADSEGRQRAFPLRGNGSGDHGALALTDGFVELAAESSVFPSGSLVPYFPWSLT